MPQECNEPSSIVTFIGFRHNLIRHELALIGFSEAPAHRGSLVIRHRIDTGAPCLDFARVFGEFVLILTGPGFGMFQQVFERFRHHGSLYHASELADFDRMLRLFRIAKHARYEKLQLAPFWRPASWTIISR